MGDREQGRTEVVGKHVAMWLDLEDWKSGQERVGEPETVVPSWSTFRYHVWDMKFS